MKEALKLYDLKKLNEFATHAQRKQSLQITPQTIWLYTLDAYEMRNGRKVKTQDTVTISLNGKIEIARESVKDVLNSVRQRGLSKEDMRQLFAQIIGKQTATPLSTADP